MEGRKHLDGDAGLGSGIVGEAIGAGPKGRKVKC